MGTPMTHLGLNYGVFFAGLRELQAGADDGGVRRGEGGRGHAGPQLLLRHPLRIQPGNTTQLEKCSLNFVFRFAS